MFVCFYISQRKCIYPDLKLLRPGGRNRKQQLHQHPETQEATSLLCTLVCGYSSTRSFWKHVHGAYFHKSPELGWNREPFPLFGVNPWLGTTWKRIGPLFFFSLRVFFWGGGSCSVSALSWGLLFKQKCSCSLKIPLTLLHVSPTRSVCVFVSNIAAANACVVHRWLLGLACMVSCFSTIHVVV